MTTWGEVEGEHASNVGFQEGSNNDNPWTDEIGAGPHAPYCISGACIVPYHHGVRWWDYSQFGEKGYAYCPYFRNGASDAGIWQDDHSSSGNPADLVPGDIVLYSWGNNGVADHAETVKAVYDDGTFDTYAYNVGNPQGVHIVRRNRKYLMGRARMQSVFYDSGPIAPPPPDVGEQEFPGRVLVLTTKKYMAGLDVAWVQQVLAHQGLIGEGDIDGYYGPQTAAAVKQLQSNYNAFLHSSLDVDGEVGPETWKVFASVRAAQGY